MIKQRAKIAALSRKAKTTGMSTKCENAFDSPPFGEKIQSAFFAENAVDLSEYVWYNDAVIL